MTEAEASEISLVLIRLEIADSAPFIDLDSCNSSYWEEDMPHHKQRGGKGTFHVSNSKPTTSTTTAETVADDLKDCEKKVDDTEKGKICRGRRTCGEVTVETLEGQSEEKNEVKDDKKIERKPFFSGNPFVEKTQGFLHIYKQNKMTPLKKEDTRRSQLLCMLAVPATLTTRELLQFLKPSSQGISQVRIIRDPSPNQYMVLIRFRCQTLADEFYSNYNGVRFTSLEPDVCHLVYVARVESMKESENASLPVDGHTELPNCPVCLERMDESVDGVLTILCNHSFHGSCLSQWGDTSCPVCRYCQTPEMLPEHKCFVCGKQEDLWICLICGYIGCGRYAEAHAYGHFQETSHTFSLQVGSQRVWDYAGDNYVHRLIQSKTDGKVVEYEPAQRNPENLESEEKIDSITLEYTYLLTNQLESQRLYFEEKLANIEKIAQAQIDGLEEEINKSAEQCGNLQTQLNNLKAEKHQLDRKFQQTSAKLQKVSSDLKEEKDLNKHLRQDQQKWSDQVKKLEDELKKKTEEKENEVKELQEQIRDMMFHLEAQEKLAEAQGEVAEEEIREGHLVVGSSPNKRGRRKKK